MKRALIYIFYLSICVAVLLEVALRIYNPFHFRVKGDHVILASNRKYIVDNASIPVLDRTIVHTKNKLGFRGPDKPPDFEQRLTMVAVGGSTTECQYLDDSKTWANILYKKLQVDYPCIWINNAGLGGQSSFGHIPLLREHLIPLKPKYVLILVGANDIRRTKMRSGNESAFIVLARNSELINVLLNVVRTNDAKSKNLTDTYLDLNRADSMRLSDKKIADYLKNEEEWVRAYRDRLDTIIDLCVANNIKPIFITQPCLPGAGSDPVTNVSLETLKIGNNQNGKLWWTMLEKYNDGTRQVAKEKNIPLIDLARLLPKSSKYFYDIIHFTNDGSEKTAGILYDSLTLLLRRY